MGNWLFVQVFRWIFYESKYLQSEYFKKITSPGWQWAACDISYRLCTGKHWNIKWPVSPYIDCTENIIFCIDDINNFHGSGNYYQAFDAKIIIGKGTYIAKNVGIITSNHDCYNLKKHKEGRDVVLGEECWIGMNSVILPGVRLGNKTIVGAGSVVTKSFENGRCVIAGNPARIIKNLD